MFCQNCDTRLGSSTVFVISRFVISRFCAIHFTVTLAGLKKIVRYTEDFVRQRFVKSGFHCNILFRAGNTFLRPHSPRRLRQLGNRGSATKILARNPIK